MAIRHIENQGSCRARGLRIKNAGKTLVHTCIYILTPLSPEF